MKKVLILSYYWPPAGGPGVQRWIRFCKSLKTYGWEPVIYTAENAQYAMLDKQLMAQVTEVEVLKKSIIEPHLLFSRLTQQGRQEVQQGYRLHDGKGSFKNKIGWFIRGNFFIPDARCLWIQPSVRYLTRILKNRKFDAIVSTGPPHSLHMIAAQLRKKYAIPWVADFRDPWTSMGYHREMPLTAIARYLHHRLEKKCVVEPDALIVVGRAVQKEFEERYGRKAIVIHNGYDDHLPKQDIALTKKFTIVHIGTFLPGRNCEELWRVLSMMKTHNKEFANQLEIKLIGNTHKRVIQSIHQHGLGDVLTSIEYIPFHETQHHLLSAQLLLLAVSKISNAKYVIPGKLFEYLKAQRPILLIGPSDGDSAAIINHCQAGSPVDFHDEDTLKKVVTAYFKKYLCGKNYIHSQYIEEFSGTYLTQKLAAVLDQTTCS